MNRFFQSETESPTGTLFRDVIFVMFLVVLAIFVLRMILPINPEVSTESNDSIQGRLRVEISWPDHMNTDVDLWVRAPGEAPVGFARKDGRIFNLVRDDLGHVNDPLAMNYEMAFAKGLEPGEYIVNVHLYSNRQNEYPVPVQVVIIYKHEDSKDANAQDIYTGTVILERNKQEITAIRFVINSDGELDEASFHDLPVSLRGGSMPIGVP